MLRCGRLETVYVMAKEPPALEERAFGFDSGIRTTGATAIFVPKGTVDKYKVADGWKEYANCIQEQR